MTDLGRDLTPLADPEVEQALLAALLCENRCYDAVSDTIAPADFWHEIHGRIFEACGTLIGRGEAANAVTLGRFFKDAAELEAVGGPDYLAELQANLVSLDAEQYAQVLRDLRIRRQAVTAGEFLIEQAMSPEVGDDARALVDGHITELDLIVGGADKSRGLAPVARDAEQVVADLAEGVARRRGGGVPGLSTGLPSLDALLCGGLRARLHVLGGASSMGKTALALAIAESVASREGPVAFFSLEMNREEILTRIVCAQSGIPVGRALAGRLTDQEIHEVRQGMVALKALHLYVDDGTAATPAAIRSRARRLKTSVGLRLVVVDYLQLLEYPEVRRRENRTSEITAITRALKRLSGDLDVPVLLLSQLSREHARRDNRRPHLSDLRESGSIEQDADVVLFCYREAYYMEREGPDKRANEDGWRADLEVAKTKCEVIAAKQRNGPLGTVVLHFDAPLIRFSERDDAAQQEEIAF